MAGLIAKTSFWQEHKYGFISWLLNKEDVSDEWQNCLYSPVSLSGKPTCSDLNEKCPL